MAEHVPEVLYKYMPPARKDFFLAPCLRFTPRAELNDPFEGKAAAAALLSTEFIKDYIEENGLDMLREHVQSSSYASMMTPEVLQTTFQAMKSLLHAQIDAAQQNPRVEEAGPAGVEQGLTNHQVGILSLSATPENLLLWAHYTQNHKGFVVAFDSGSPFFNRKKREDDPVRHLVSVTYGERPILTYSPERAPEEFFRSILYVKSSDWVYEQEWRMLISETKNMMDFGVQGVESVPVEAIKGIFLGLNVSAPVKALALRFRREHPEIPLLQVKLHRKEFRLEFDPMPLAGQ